MKKLPNRPIIAAHRLSLLALPVVAAVNLTAATLVVTNCNDSGPGSFRQAILDANANPGLDTVQFSLPSQTIAPASPLPVITDPVIIDGWTQPGFANNPIIELAGSNCSGDGLQINTSGCTVRGLAINRFSGSGIVISGKSDNVIEGNYIGVALDGVQTLGNKNHGILIQNSSSNVIGGASPTSKNVVSGNSSAGIRLEYAPGTKVLGNIIGLDWSGTFDRGNAGSGICIVWSDQCAIGSPVLETRNVIAGNGDEGIWFSHSAQNSVQGNLIGTDITGTAGVRNGLRGIYFDNHSVGNLVGGTTASARNLISGNRYVGIRMDGGSSNNVVQGNFIGTDVNGLAPLSNGGHGIYIVGTTHNTIGGTTEGTANRIAFNDGAGVDVGGGVANSILGNSIFSNSALGIDLEPTGVTTSDLFDLDSGPNNLQNYPVLSAAINTASGLHITGTLNTVPNTSGIIIEFFGNDAPDPTGYGEGKTFLGRITVNTDGAGNAIFNQTLPATVSYGSWISATATAAGNTSEFSACQPAVQTTNLPPSITLCRLSNGVAHLTLAVQPGRNYAVEYSTNLTSWAELTNFLSLSSSVETLDGAAATCARRFYRVNMLP